MGAAAELHAACLGLRERGTGALRSHLSFMLRDGGDDVNREAVRGRHIDDQKVHAGLHEVGDESDIARKTIQARDNERRTLFAASVERRKQLWAVGVLAPAFDFRELRQRIRGRADVAGDGGCASRPKRKRPGGRSKRGNRQRIP